MKTVKKTRAERACDIVRDLLDVGVSLYMAALIVILPLYSTESGYRSIGTDKSMFFRSVSLTACKVILPLTALYLVLLAVRQWRLAPGRFSGIRTGGRDGSMRARGRTDGTRTRSRAEKHGAGERLPSVTDLFALLYLAAVICSYLHTPFKQETEWGDTFYGTYSWYLGLLTQLLFLGIYFAVSRLWQRRDWMAALWLPTAAAVALLGYLNRFGVRPLEMQGAGPQFISTIGNINWYCGYAVTVFFPGAAFLWQGGGKGRGQTILLTLYVWLGFAALVTQGSASGIMTLAAVMLLLFVLSAGESGRMCRFWMLAFLLGAACLFTEILTMLPAFEVNLSDALMNLLITGPAPIIMTVVSFLAWQWMRRRAGASDDAGQKGRVFRKKGRIAAIIVVTAVSFALAAFAALIILNTLRPGSIGGLSRYGIFTFSDDWGSKRGATWKAGVRCFSEQDLPHKLTGVGPDAMEAFLYRDGSRELTESLREAFGSNRLTNAHNEWLTVLVNTGIPGLAGFGGMMVSAMLCFRKRGEKNPVAGSCGVALFAYTVNNIFSFQQIMNITQVYVLLGMGMAFLRAEQVRE